ncbi:Hypothetical Protein FCC1311_078452 [Hondaea fermentalgiana]|uniref:Uncharacterized protein n=1 Tax=Hondaea fermentalgiana TaxID=2315210 RepID=A0A2R5GL71_9STRA|nr:Hypothetical Protein FCC1311_078452 [Hondaea fermentalgiana]|eukprot:GBG31620.1 Hypothetical Protein FCC1311_078452 [Hondaea fermentalgiana]
MAAATAIVTVASVSAVSVSLAYQLTRVMLYKAVEAAANTAIALLAKNHESVGRVQFILMELDVEAKFKTVRSLLEAVESDEVELAGSTSEDFIHVCVSNVRDVMETITITLTRIQNSMDAHAKMWFNAWRKLDVVDDLELLKAQCRMFDKRLETLIQCLSVPSKGSHEERTAHAQHGLINQLIFGDARTGYDEEDERATEDLERTRSHMLALQAHNDAEMIGEGPRVGASASGLSKSRSATGAAPKTTVLFEDPVFL